MSAPRKGCCLYGGEERGRGGGGQAAAPRGEVSGLTGGGGGQARANPPPSHMRRRRGGANACRRQCRRPHRPYFVFLGGGRGRVGGDSAAACRRRQCLTGPAGQLVRWPTGSQPARDCTVYFVFVSPTPRVGGAHPPCPKPPLSQTRPGPSMRRQQVGEEEGSARRGRLT